MTPAAAQPAVLYLVPGGPPRQAVRAALMAMNVLPREATADAAGLHQLRDTLDQQPECLAIIDLQALRRPIHHPLALAGVLDDPASRARVVLARGNGGAVWDADRAWIRDLGFCGLVPGLDCTSLLGDAASVLDDVARCTGAGVPAGRKLQQYFSAMQVKPEPGTPRGLIRGLTGCSAEGACAALAQGAPTMDRSHKLTRYPACFIGSQGVDWLCARYRVTRPQAVSLGQALQALGMLCHVVHEQAFADAHLFFRTTWLPQAGQLQPGAVLQQLRGPSGVVVRDRSYRARSYPACFVGSEAVDRIQAWAGLPRHACEGVLNRLHGYGLIDHVTHDHPVRDGHFYYRFAEGTLGAGPWSPAQAAPQLPITPPSALRITTVDDRGRPPAV